ncbi:hypothetical protein SAMN05444156_1311 [Verrucomicrobium sp. GAS474]|nr:hypothetical protein SAMN05444156_1311 [Verrucomicrobium sp. GAS474]
MSGLVGLSLAVLTLATLPPSPARAVIGGTTRDVFCAHGFSLSRYETFSFEPLEGEADYNGLSDADWAQVRAAFVAEMAAHGYRHVEKGGQLQLSYGAFPPIDAAHPVTGLFVKFRTGLRMFDLTKWSGGAMVDGPYTPATLAGIVPLLGKQIPLRTGPTAESSAAPVSAAAEFMPASAR